jgi:DEAD/DEAH box helicase domain-containing protein
VRVDVQSVVRKLLEHPTLGPMVAHRQRIDGRPARYASPERPLPALLREALAAQGIERLYRHQARGLDLAREGRDVVAVTPTASGKTLLFALAALESVLDDPRSKALFLYPTKALARDQLGTLRGLAGGLGALRPPRFEIYDGDTPAARRRKIKAEPPQGLITNPDMLHLGILAHHRDWEPFFRDLRWIVLDELHVYRGIFGAHVHHILARLRRVAARYGASPRFIAASATVGNPGEFAATLAGRPFEVVAASGAARAPLEVVFLNPVGVSPYTVAVRLLAEFAGRGLRTIAFTKARRITELIYTWLAQQQPALRSRVAPYRAGYLPEERRALERRLFDGDLSAVIATSALELGIDVGGLDACILVGYPGSLISSWQRIGRVGRRGEGLVVLVAMPDALDQYVVHHPELFFGRRFEKAVLDPWNPFVAGQHLVCAAAEEPLRRPEVAALGTQSLAAVEALAAEGRLVEDAAGTSWFSFRRRPHRDVSPRSAGRPYLIVTRGTGSSQPERDTILGKIDGLRVRHECHPGAIYLHGGQSYLVLELDEERRRVVARPARVDYYTVVLGEKETEILEQRERRRLGEFCVGYGRLKVTVRIRGYQKRRMFGGEPLSSHPLDVPPVVYETVGFWIELPAGLPAAFASRDLHFMGGIHATEHAIIGLFPLLAIADRGDVGGISYTGHPQLGAPAIFIYDGVPGGAGLAEQGFRDLESLLERTLDLIRGCACEDGCPGCIQSPNCGNGNKPLDKRAAQLVLGTLVGHEPLASLGVEAAPDRDPAPIGSFDAASRPPGPDRLSQRKHGITRAGNVEPLVAAPAPAEVLPSPPPSPTPVGPADDRAQAPAGETVLVFDLETQRSAEEVGGWAHTDRMGLALAVVHDVRRDVWRTYYEADVHRLLLDLVMADCVVGFNIARFDLTVLSGYSDWDLGRIRTLDLLGEIRRQLGFRVSLNHLSEMNLGEAKAGDGLQSLRWWKEGRIDLIEQYCRKDVDMTRRLYELGRSRGYLLYRDHAKRSVRVPVHW